MKTDRGFTLVELSIVVVLMGMMLTLGMAAINAQRAQMAISATQKKQEIIREALVAYLRQNRRLPCPDLTVPPNGTGDDDRATPGNVATSCTGDTGVLPYGELGLGRDIALDGWEDYQTYKVSNPLWTVSTSFSQGNPGGFTISDRNTAGTASVTVNGAVVALISHGINGLGAMTVKGTAKVFPEAGTDEAINATWAGVTNVFKREYSEVAIGASGAFDDIVSFLTVNDLISPLLRDGSLRSPEGELNRIRSDVYNFVASAVLATGSVPSSLAAAGIDLQGPWGNVVGYTQGCLLSARV